MKSVGIDLGTTNSVVSYLNGEVPSIIPNSHGDNLTPSAVFLPLDGSIVVGAAAKEQEENYPERTFLSIKRRMGSEYRRNVDGKDYGPEEISSMILGCLKRDAEAHLGKQVEGAVITVPANFNSAERQATKTAGEIAGLEVSRVLNEPTAAALAYGHLKKLSRAVVVFDLGGGTFDISVVLSEGELYEVLYSLGDNRLGGDDFNMRILAHMVEVVKEKHDLDLLHNKASLRRLRNEAVRAKHDLTSHESTRIYLPNVGISRGRRVDLDMDFSRRDLARVAKPILDRIRGYAERVVEELTKPDYSNRYGDVLGQGLECCDVLLVGGETRLHCVRETMAEVFVGKVFCDINPDEVVAMGAAIQAGIIDRNDSVKDIILVDSTSLSLGTRVVDGSFSRIIPANVPLPVTRTKAYYTVANEQTEVKVKVYQGESSIAEQNKLLGEFTLHGIPPRPAGDSEVLVTFDLDVNDILHVEARDKATGRRAQTTIKNATTLPPEQVEAMKREARERENQNSEALRAFRLKAQSEDALLRVEQSIQPLRSVLHPDYLRSLDELGQGLRRALAESDMRAVERLFYDLYHLLPKPCSDYPSLALQVTAATGFRVDEWGRLEATLTNNGSGVAREVQVAVSGRALDHQAGAADAIYPDAVQTIAVSINPVEAGQAVPLTLSVEYRDDSGVPYMVTHNVAVEVARQDAPVAAEGRTLINIGEIITHAGGGDVHSGGASAGGDQVAGGKAGDVVSTRSGVNLGVGEGTARDADDGVYGTGAESPVPSQECIHCGADLPPGFVFCGRCGKSQGRKCPGCGLDVPVGFSFCGKCGTKL